ncbi:FAD-dependent pyridine nucleotide-disulfide oxidoreductase [Penicillium hispanicum]|uniref:FAD-dependent pyridine nucleotide-disulfide oxidoreductase n=1 Tax=Penicillium hispanicum TaxID=1080232 RepID=UPI00253F9A48|nr:FAD-dependent pyridine nucleotide-disulfide oxidoreductase [Penicillium hispanicum]KAJ5578209.1 FAD-dependent pyridine nucleotide-disulfide oxidoreductase [Penicillium hispanicum]
MDSKKVAIIGAGPSGLVTAKTLLHNFSRGTFAPVIFDSRHEVGGLWPNTPGTQSSKANGPPGTLDPCMRTNLSRFTVAFSDLSWESVVGETSIPMFPQARQVGQYLAAYAERYIPRDVLRLGHRVIRTARITNDSSHARWRISWTKESHSQNTNRESNLLSDEVMSEEFDYLVVASGYFARQYIPDIPGLEHFAGRIVHSSAIQKGRDILGDDYNATNSGNVAVIGGSMSGVEAAAAAALEQSSTRLSVGATRDKKCTVHHLYSRPFWTLPTYLPHETSDQTVSFLPLDLAMYDLGRRPPGPIGYSLGPIPEEKAIKTNEYFKSLLGAEYERYGHMQPPCDDNDKVLRPPWVAIGNDYAEFVRSGAIEATMGRAISVHPDSKTGLASIKVQATNGQQMMLQDIAAIVMATGFTPFESLSILPTDVLSSLEYTTEDPFLPLILDKGGTLRSEIPDLGFVGFYRGPYWGVMEMQARFLGAQWTAHDEPTKTEEQRESMRALRHPDTSVRRGQFPMGDYVGLMEAFATDLGIARTEWPGGDSRSGPVVPARYVHDRVSSVTVDGVQTTGSSDIQQTLEALEATSNREHHTAQAAAALAIFRGLHGSWKFTRMNLATGQVIESGSLVFHPRFPSKSSYDKEYVVEEHFDSGSTGDDSLYHKPRSILRLSETGTAEANSRIESWSASPAGTMGTDNLLQALQLTPFYRKKREDAYIPGEYVIYANRLSPVATRGSTQEAIHDDHQYQYIFHFKGVSIATWECIGLEGSAAEDGTDSEGRPLPRARTVYERQQV